MSTIALFRCPFCLETLTKIFIYLYNKYIYIIFSMASHKPGLFRSSAFVFGCICLNFGQAIESRSCAFMYHASFGSGPCRAQLAYCWPRPLISKLFATVRKPFLLRMSNEVLPGSEQGVALPQRNLQQESGWLQASPLSECTLLRFEFFRDSESLQGPLVALIQYVHQQFKLISQYFTG